MKVHSLKRNMIELYQKDRRGFLLHVYQVDTPDWGIEDDPQRALTLPIYVEGAGIYAKALEDLIEERAKAMGDTMSLEKELDEVKGDRICLKEELAKLRKKKWYQFWK